MKRDRAAEQTAAAANPSANWMLYAMVACCAAIPLALVTAMLLAHRMARSPHER
jgi:hypothetical protein